MSDPHAASNIVPDEVQQEMLPDPEIEALKYRRVELKGNQFQIRSCEDEAEIKSLSQQIRNKEGQRNKKVKIRYCKYYFKNRPTWDIEKYFSREAEDSEEEYEESEEEYKDAEEEYVTPAIELYIPERTELAELLVNQPEDLSDKALRQLRISYNELITALNYKQETAKRRRIQEKVLVNSLANLSTEVIPGLDPFPLLIGKIQYPRYIRDERQSYKERTFPYCRTAVMNNYFGYEHLKEI